MRLVDLDKLNIPGKSKVLEVLDRWEKEHLVTEITAREDDEWDIRLVRKKTKE
jgi:hypothetical protein